MRGKTSLTTALLALLIFVALLSAVSPPSFATANVAVTPPSIVGPPPSIDETFSVNITVSSVVDLYSWQVGMTFNASMLEALSFDEGPFLKQGGTTIMVNGTIDNLAGNITKHGVSLTGPVPGVNGSGALATVTFRVKDYGSSTLHLTDVILLDSQTPQNAIPVTVSDGYVEISPLVLRHDVAVVGVGVAYPLGANETTGVYAGWKLNVTVTVKNEGDYTESFSVTAYNGTGIIGTQSVADLAPGANTTLLYPWDTTGVVHGNYTIKAVAVLPEDAEPADNTMIDGVVKVKFPGDADGSGFVDVSDFAILAASWFKGYPDPDYDVRADFNGSGFVDVSDFAVLATHWFQGI